jgi:hypothetical protein
MSTTVEPEVKSFGEQRTALQKEVDAAVLERVKRGMALLEERHGPDWVGMIDLAELDLRDGHSCVLGQVYLASEEGDGYSCGVIDLDIEVTDHNYGFSVTDDELLDLGEDTAWERLQKVWEYVLTPHVFKKE